MVNVFLEVTLLIPTKLQLFVRIAATFVAAPQHIPSSMLFFSSFSKVMFIESDLGLEFPPFGFHSCF